jgi:predicted S18 family serine protease
MERFMLTGLHRSQKIEEEEEMNPFKAFLIVTPFALASCASQPPVPNEQLAVSKTAVEQAQRAQAGDYAPIELKQAQDKLNLAQAAVQKEDYVTAQRLAKQAEVDARLAETKAHSARAQNAVAQINESIRALRLEIERR